ncbi:MAG: 4-hydroxyproline epimerase [Saprospiraceae bacterium]|nr:4-hydroxyproline epimerase [Saprospiraceae bacterium]
MISKKRFFCIDAHTCGNPVRLVAGGGPTLEGNNMMEKRINFLHHSDWIRKSLMFEPRGHDMMSGSILYPPSDHENDVGVLFIETSGCLPMCGHGLIGTITIAIEEGYIHPKNPPFVKVETPAGLIIAEYSLKNQKVDHVKLTNIASFLLFEKIEVLSDVLGPVYVDIAYGGNFYAIIDPQQNFRGMEHYSADQLISMSRGIRSYINNHYEIIHPENPEIKGCSHVMWTGKVLKDSSTARNAVFYGDKAIDRSPCGTGTSARMAQWAHKGLLSEGQDFIHESYIGSQFTGKIEGRTSVGDIPAIIPSIQGWAKIYGYNTILVDPEDDPYAAGFQVI